MGLRNNTRTKNIVKFLKSFSWKTLSCMYGSAHSSIIGFISSEWINQSQYNMVLDGAPSSKKKGRHGRKHADILLFKKKKPYVVVEVESGASEYCKKIDSIQKYLTIKKFDGLEFGLLVMTNVYGLKRGESCWDILKNKIKKMKGNIALVSLEKTEANLGTSRLDHLRSLDKNGYSSKTIVKIVYRIPPNQDIDRTLYGKNEK